ncbi:MAG: head GIN domain-containing protein [Bacteroidota bacterium]
MKKLQYVSLVIACAFLGTTGANAQWGNKKVVGNGNVTTKTVSTGSYDGVKGVGSMDIHLEKGSEGSISVTTDDNLHEYLEIKVKDNMLIVKTKKNVNIRTKKGIHVTVPYEDISKVSLVGSGDIDNKGVLDAPNLDLNVTGSGDVELNVNTGKLDARVTGSGDMVISGKTVDLEVNLSGSGDFDGSDLAAKNTEANVSGSGDISVVAKESIKARVHGSGDITYTGNPERSDTKTSGSGSISSN